MTQKRKSVLRQIAQLQEMNHDQLKERWSILYGVEPPCYNRPFLIKRLAYRIQELAYGGLSQSAKERMKEVLEENGFNEMGGAPKTHAKLKKGMPIIGTRLVREWNEGRYEATVVKGGFEFEGRIYRSLTAITKAITGTHWNGPAFFGLRQNNTNPDNGSAS